VGVSQEKIQKHTTRKKKKKLTNGQYPTITTNIEVPITQRWDKRKGEEYITKNSVLDKEDSLKFTNRIAEKSELGEGWGGRVRLWDLGRELNRFEIMREVIYWGTKKLLASKGTVSEEKRAFRHCCGGGGACYQPKRRHWGGGQENFCVSSMLIVKACGREEVRARNLAVFTPVATIHNRKWGFV